MGFVWLVLLWLGAAAQRVVFDARGGAHPPYFCFAKSKQKHLLQHAGHRVAMTSLRYSVSPALAKLAIADRSDNASFSPGSPALLGGMKSRLVH